MYNIKYQIRKEYSAYSSWLLDIPESFDSLGEIIYSKRNIIRKVTSPNGEQLVVKRFRKPNLIQKIGYSFFRKSKALRAFSFAEFLIDRNLHTPFPVAYLELYDGQFLKSCYFISVYEEGENCWELNDDASNSRLAHGIADFMVRLHEKGFMHGDPNLSNFLYKNLGDRYEISTLDLNRSHIIENPSPEECLQNFMRITHELPIMELIVRDYAKMRNWDETYCINYVEDRIRSLERHEDIRGIVTMKEPEYRERKREKINHAGIS